MGVLIYTDGGSRNNPGEAGIGAVIYKEGEVVAEVSEYIGIQTNNWAEYQAIIRALETVLECGLQDEVIEIRMDSKLAAEQLKGSWKVKEPTLKPQFEKARLLIEKCTEVRLVHVPREENKVADKLANEAMDRGK